MSGVDWGTVPAWASAILTSGSLLLGFYILLRDRRKDERSEALKVICWMTRRPGGVTIHISNLSERMITYPDVVVSFERGGPLAYADFGASPESESLYLMQDSVVVLRPNEEVSRNLSFTEDDQNIQVMGVRFVDADGILWTREINGGKLIRRVGHSSSLIDPGASGDIYHWLKRREEKERVKKFRRASKGRRQWIESHTTNSAVTFGMWLARHVEIRHGLAAWRRARKIGKLNGDD